MRGFEEGSEAIEVGRGQTTQACVPGLGLFPYVWTVKTHSLL